MNSAPPVPYSVGSQWVVQQPSDRFPQDFTITSKPRHEHYGLQFADGTTQRRVETEILRAEQAGLIRLVPAA